MPCSFAMPLSDDAISAALDGQAEAPIQQHLAHCYYCASRLAEARKVEQKLMSNLYRWDCPTAQQLGDYYLKLISPAEARDIGEHVASCVRCKAEIEELRAFLDAEAAPTPKPQPQPQSQPPRERTRPRLGELIAQLLPQSFAPAMRGADSGPLMAETDGATIFLEVQPAVEGAMLVGQVVAEDLSLWVGALVQLRQSGTLQATAALDDLGSFRCGPLSSGRADLRITSRVGRNIALYGVDFGT